MPVRQDDLDLYQIIKFTNCRILKDRQLVNEDLWIDARSGKILNAQKVFYELQLSPNKVIDLHGKILCPGFIDVQINGAHGFDFSVPRDSKEDYEAGLKEATRGLARTGVTSFLPTTVSSTSEVYRKVLPFLAPWGRSRDPSDGAESLGAHVEGPFINPVRNGVHKPDVLLSVRNGLQDILDCYGVENFPAGSTQNGATTQNRVTTQSSTVRVPAIKMITAAPEVGDMLKMIPEIRARGVIFSIGHSDATYQQALAAVGEGATMVTHLFNAMRPFLHRNPGVFGLLGQSEQPKPFFGIIADGIHLHPTSIKIAYHAHSQGLILVTDAMRLCGLPDGVYEWTNGDRIIKEGARLTLEGSDRLAGSSATLIECVNNFRRWSGATTAEALAAVTSTPAKMLGMDHIKGTLEPGADADLVVLGEKDDPYSGQTLTVDQVWKFGVKIYEEGSEE